MTDTPENEAPGLGTPTPVPAARPKRAATGSSSKARKQAQPKEPDGDRLLQPASEDPNEKLMCITLHDGPHIPPGGQFVGVNGKQFWIRPGIQVVVPRYVLGALDNAIQGTPLIDTRGRLEGMTNAPRITYTVHHDWDGQYEGKVA
jgi:hypothetical protein